VKTTAFILALALAAHGAHGAASIPLHVDRPGFVSLAIYRADGSLARPVLAGAPFDAGDHVVPLDGKPLPPGDYTWRALFHEGLALKTLGSIGDFGGDRGVPSATAADDARVYLGWSLTSADANDVVACDPSGAVLWTHRRGSLSGCRALGVDAGTLYVLGGEGADADGRAIYRLDAKTGAAVPWPDGRIDIEITSLWPAHGKYKPALADYLAVNNGRIYLSFSDGQFMAVLDAKSGVYLQTIVGAPPGPVDSVATKSDNPAKPDQLIDADFVVTALKGGDIGEILLAHDPIWVLADDLTPIGGDQAITALTMIGDGAKHHAHDIFCAVGPPWNQIEARSALAMETVTYAAGKPGGRISTGVWQPARMGRIRAIALDAAGQLWVAEGDTTPSRVSVWTTDAPNGRLVREFFSPPDPGAPVAIDPADPRVMFAAGCEWRIDPATGRAACTGVVTREPFTAARFVMEKTKLLLVLTPATGAEVVLERAGDGDYRPHPASAPAASRPRIDLVADASGKWRILSADGCDLGALPLPDGAAARARIAPTLTETPDGRVFLAARGGRIWNLELTGLETLRTLATGKFTIAGP
jgi:hypothetical protein